MTTYQPLDRFNLRVYGLWLKDDREVLLSRELIGGRVITKFPGGGMMLGEGAIDALRREWREELHSAVTVLRHFYTTDFCQPSAWDNSQVISIYYQVTGDSAMAFPYENGCETFYFAPVDAMLPERLDLPIDRVVAARLISD